MGSRELKHGRNIWKNNDLDFPKSISDTKQQIQEAQRTPNSTNAKTIIPRHIIFKCRKSKTKKNILKGVIVKAQYTGAKQKIHLTAQNPCEIECNETLRSWEKEVNHPNSPLLKKLHFKCSWKQISQGTERKIVCGELPWKKSFQKKCDKGHFVLYFMILILEEHQSKLGQNRKSSITILNSS